MKRALDTAAVAVRFEYMSIWTTLMPSRVGCSFQSKLFSISKLLYLVFVVKLSPVFALENCALFLISLRCS